MFALMDPSVGWEDLEELVSECNLPVLVKGILTAEDAALACEHGAGRGRRLEPRRAPARRRAATIDALPEVVDAVEGRVEVLVDGGIRRGTDVVKALALGARAVLAGRAPLWGSPRARRQGRARCSSCCARRSSSRWCWSAAPSVTRAVGRTHVRTPRSA